MNLRILVVSAVFALAVGIRAEVMKTSAQNTAGAALTPASVTASGAISGATFTGDGTALTGIPSTAAYQAADMAIGVDTAAHQVEITALSLSTAATKTVTDALTTSSTSAGIAISALAISTPALRVEIDALIVSTIAAKVETAALTVSSIAARVDIAALIVSTIALAAVDAGKQDSFIGITSGCASGYYLDNSTHTNGVATGGICTLASAGGGETNTYTSTKTFTSAVLLASATIGTNGTQTLITNAGLINAVNGSRTTPAWSFASDTDVGAWKTGTDAMSFGVNSSTRIHITNGMVWIGAELDAPPAFTGALTVAGNSLLGSDKAYDADLDVVGSQPRVLHTVDTGGRPFLMGLEYGNNTGPSVLAFMKTRSTAYNANTAVNAQDSIMDIRAYGANGQLFKPAVKIEGAIDGEPGGSGTTDMPGRLVFYTTPDGSATLVERMRIISSGSVGINVTAPLGMLDVAGNVVIRSSVPPSAVVTDGVVLFSTDVVTAELEVLDEAGNVTVLSPHRFDMFEPDLTCPYPWSYRAENSFIGKAVNVDLCKLAMAVEVLTGQKFMYTQDIPKKSWSANEIEKQSRRQDEIIRFNEEQASKKSVVDDTIAAWTTSTDAKKGPCPEAYVVVPAPPTYKIKAMPGWMDKRK